MKRLILVFAVLSLIFSSFVSVEGRVIDKAVERQITAKDLDQELINFSSGDVNGDGKINITDVVYLINYLFKGGPEPLCPPAPYLGCADVNCDGKTTVSDVIYLINYLFRGGPSPGCPVPGWIDGMVYNSNTNEPLEGAIIKIASLSDSVFSDSAGRFFFEVISGRELVLTIRKPGFTYAQRKAIAVESLDVAVDPVYLKPLDTLITRITPAGGTAVDSRGHIQLIFPPNAVPYDIDVIATDLDKGKELPMPLPELSFFTYCAELEPHGVVFNDSVTLRVSNYLGFNPGTRIPVGFFDTDSSKWIDVGMAKVTPDKQWAECKITRFSFHDINMPPVPPPQDDPPDVDENESEEIDNKDVEDEECVGSSVDFKSGQLRIFHSLPPVRSLGVTQPLTFCYNSSSANPNPIITTRTKLNSDTTNVPKTVTWKLQIAGRTIEKVFEGDSGSARQAILFDGKNAKGEQLATGSYPYTLTISNDYDSVTYGTAECFGCPATGNTEVLTRETVPLKSVETGRVVINNRVNSPFGAGWGIVGFQELFSAFSSVVLAEGSGSSLTFLFDRIIYGPNNFYVIAYKPTPTTDYFPPYWWTEDSLYHLYSYGRNHISFKTLPKPIMMSDCNGNQISYTYNESGLLFSITDPVGQVTSFVYDALGHLREVTDPAGRKTLFEIDSLGDLVGIAAPDSSVTRFVYEDHLLTHQINPKGDTTKYIYDDYSRIKEVVGPGCTCKEFAITPADVQGIINSLPDSVGTEENPAPSVAYDSVYTAVQDANGNLTKIQSNKFGSTTAKINALGHTTLFERDDNSNITKIVKPNGAIIRMTYDGWGNMTSYTDSSTGATTEYTYNTWYWCSTDRVTSIKDPKGYMTLIEYQGANPIRIIDALNDTTRMEYNTRGQLTKIINALGDSSMFRYDSLGNLEVATNPLGDSVVLAYNLAGDVISAKDALGRVTRYEYDIMGRLIKEIDADSNIAQYEYDEKGNLTKVIDAKLHETQFFYDRRDQLVKTINPSGDSTIYQYDINGNLILSINPKGDSIHHEYDPLDRLIRKVLPDDSTLYLYDVVGNLTMIKNSDNRLGFNYDLNDRLVVARANEPKEVQPPPELLYGYDLNGNLQTMDVTYPSTGFGRFGSQIIYDTPSPFSVIAADLDTVPGKDMAVAANHGFYVYLNKGDGSFQPRKFYYVEGSPATLRAEDLDGDGDKDIATGDHDETVTIFINDGNGDFQLQEVIEMPDYYPYGIVHCISIDDLNGDTYKDIVVSREYGSRFVIVIFNRGDATFESSVLYDVWGQVSAHSCEDLDGDGDKDLVVVYEGQSLGIWFNDGNGNFADPTWVYLTAGYARSTYCGDLDGDGDIDIATSSVRYYDGSVSIFLNDGAASFTESAVYEVGARANAIVGTDLDGDGDLDLATAKEGGSISVLLNRGNATFTPARQTLSGKILDDYPQCIYSEDMNGDGKKDLLLAEYWSASVSIFLNAGNGTFPAGVDYETGQNPHGICATDLDQNGEVDLVVTNWSDNNVSVFRNFNGVYENSGNYYTGLGPRSVISGDLDGDGDIDISVTNENGNSISVLFNKGGGSFGPPLQYAVGDRPLSIASGDFDRDGDFDLAVVNYGSDNLYVLLNDGSGSFYTSTIYSVGDGPFSVVSEDFNGDGYLDLSTVNWNSSNVSILLNKGNGTFFSAIHYSSGGTNPSCLVSKDLDGDGDFDLAIGNENSKSVSVLLNDSTGVFHLAVAYQLNGQPHSMTSQDFDKDGHSDLAAVMSDINKIVILFSDGTGNFKDTLRYCGTRDYPVSIVSLDFDSDGDMDLAVANKNSNSITVFSNGPDPLPAQLAMFKYDELNRLTSIVADNTDTTLFAYDRLSRRSSKQYPNGFVAEYGYDKASQLLSLVNRLNADTISKYNYAYDPVGNRIKMLEKAGVDSFTYDVLYRLTGAIHPQPSNPPENFDYDGVGNRTTSHISTNYTYDAANRLIEDDQYQYRYDKNGNLVWKMSKAAKKPRLLKSKGQGGFDKGVIKEEERTAGDSTVYIWNAENTLLGFAEYHLGDTAKLVSYKYDGLGRRIEKKVDTLVTKYVYDNEDIIFELDGNDSVIAIYTHGPGIDEPISVQRNGAKYYYHQDGLGSVTYITDTLGNSINTYLYDSFGNIKQKTGGLENPYTYTGREWDEESGIFYYRARYYDPRIGRFLSPDPIRLPKSMNSFWYVSNNSTNLSDPFGLSESGFWKFFPIFWDLWDFFWDPCWPEPSYEPPKPIQAKGPNPEAAEAWRMASGKDYLISGDYGVSGRGASQVLDPIKALIIANYETGDLKTFEQVYNQGIREGADFPGTAYSYYQYVFSEYWWFEVR